MNTAVVLLCSLLMAPGQEEDQSSEPTSWFDIVPYAWAADILLTGRHILAPEAKAIGLISEVVPDGSAMEKAMEVAAKVLAATALDLITDPDAVAAARRSFREVRDPRTFSSLLPPDAKPPSRIRKD